MQEPRPRLRSFAALLAAAAVLSMSDAGALGLGGGASGAVLGQPLDFAVQVRLDPADTLEARCISAEVTVGDRQLPASAVRTVLDSVSATSARIRVQTLATMDEPVIGVQLTAGCLARVSRSFVVLADPPSVFPPQAMAPVSVDVVLRRDAPPAPADEGRPLDGLAQAQAQAQAQALVLVPSSTGAQASGPAVPSSASRTSAQAGQTAAATAATAATAAAPSAPAAAAEPRVAEPPRAAAPSAPRARSEPTPRPRPQAERPSRRTEPGPSATRPAAVAAAPTAAPSPRLRLDAPEPPPSAEAQAIEQAIEAVAQATIMARAAADAASASAARMAALERTVEQLRADGRTAAAFNADLRGQLAQAQGADRWLWPLLVGLVVLGGLAAWLAWRLADLQRLRQHEWQNAALSVLPVEDPGPGKQPTAPIPFVTSELTMPTPLGSGAGGAGSPGGAAIAAAPRQRPSPAWPPPAPLVAGPRPPDLTPPPPPRAAPRSGEPQPYPTLPGTRTVALPAAAAAAAVAVAAPAQPAQAVAPPADARTVPLAPPAVRVTELAEDPAMQRTQPLPPPRRGDEGAPRDVSIEELIDLEQQAEFFVVLGQDESAIDLLVDHLRNTGGGSPLPYLKLLEIYGRRGDREAYERTRGRFNHRFNAYAPDWGADLAHGRTLEDYPGVLPRLEQVWPRPLDSMAELEALLFRKSRGELFDLPAYREVLFLYALSRDRLDREGADSGTVDLLLPLSDGGEFSSTTPHPYYGVRAGESGGPDSDFGHIDDRPTAPVDLDLSQPEPPRGSLFGSREETTPPRRL